MKLLINMLSIVCTAVVAACGWTVCAETSALPIDDTVAFDSQNIAISFGAMSDIHLKAQADENDSKFANTLKKFKELAGGSDKLHTVVIAGDLFDAAPDVEAPRFMNILQANLNPNDTEVIPSVGNHDYYFDGAFSGKNKFKDAFGAFVYKNPVEKNTTDDIVLSANYHTVINGIHFISVNGFDGDHSSVNLMWLKMQLRNASKDNPKLPIFVITHSPPADTMYGSDKVGRFQSTTIGPVLENFPQVVIFAGHTHKSAIEDTSVWRGSYTAVGTGFIQKSADFVQVDKNGVVKITPYLTSTTLSGMKEAHRPWIFKTKEALPTTTNPSITSKTESNKVQQAGSQHWYSDTTGYIIAIAAVCIVLLAVAAILLRKRTNAKNK